MRTVLGSLATAIGAGWLLLAAGVVACCALDWLCVQWRVRHQRRCHLCLVPLRVRGPYCAACARVLAEHRWVTVR